MDSQNKRLSSNNRQLLATIEASIGKTPDVRQAGEYDLMSPDYARGYLDGLVRQASDENVLMVYFLTKLVL